MLKGINQGLYTNLTSMKQKTQSAKPNFGAKASYGLSNPGQQGNSHWLTQELIDSNARLAKMNQSTSGLFGEEGRELLLPTQTLDEIHCMAMGYRPDEQRLNKLAIVYDFTAGGPITTAQFPVESKNRLL